MRLKLTSTTLLICFSTLVALALGEGRALAADSPLKLEVQLIWGTDASQSPDAKHKPVEAEVRKKLKDLPLKWTNYFEVFRQKFDVPLKQIVKVPLSDKCSIEVNNINGLNIEVGLWGKGEQVVRRIQKLPKGEILVFGGNAPNATAWLVILKRIE
jgi:hypothetical protein